MRVEHVTGSEQAAFADHPAWATLEKGYRELNYRLTVAAAKASSENHPVAKGQLEGAEKLWNWLWTIRQEWMKGIEHGDR
jgi:hypothetical protein